MNIEQNVEVLVKHSYIYIRRRLGKYLTTHIVVRAPNCFCSTLDILQACMRTSVNAHIPHAPDVHTTCSGMIRCEQAIVCNSPHRTTQVDCSECLGWASTQKVKPHEQRQEWPLVSQNLVVQLSAQPAPCLFARFLSPDESCLCY